MKIKRHIYTAGASLLLTLAVVSGCSNDSLTDTPQAEEQALQMEGVALSMDSADDAEVSAATRATRNGYSVNTANDPTKTDLGTQRKEWKLDFTLYNNNTASTDPYTAGSFTGGTYNAGGYWEKTGGTTYYFPNYHSPKAELSLYKTTKGEAIAVDQSTAESILAQDELMQKNNGTNLPTLTPAHIIIKGTNSSDKIRMVHKHSMLDFVIDKVTVSDIDEVKVKVGENEYIPYKVAATSSDNKLEYMLILPEGTDVNPVVHVTTIQGAKVDAIHYQQTIKILATENPTSTLGTNKCYCFTLTGKALEISPITITDWTRGESLPGEYIAVTAYPTFKAADHANETYYFYYDNKLTIKNGETSEPKLQEITFNQDGECTIKPDGRILTHIFRNDSTIPNDNNKLSTPIVLGAMVIDVNGIIKALEGSNTPV